MNFFDDHRKLFLTATAMFVVLSLLIAVMPALHNQKNNAPLPDAEPLSAAAERGKALFVANGCVACHTQQVRNIEMDKLWGSRPSLPADYAAIERMDFWRNTATLMGTERTGPDLTDIGTRQPSLDWNLVHLYNPRIVVKESIMPAYPWLFKLKAAPDSNDVIVNLPASYTTQMSGKIIATADALDLIAYLQSLKQAPLPASIPPSEFLYKRPDKDKTATLDNEPDGKALYTTHCQSCHQANGEGLPGAFPPLKGSPVVLDKNLDLYIDIIMNGYDARPEYGAMAAVGMNAEFTEKEVAAIINYERSNWGNNGEKVSAEEIKSIVDFVKLKSQ